MRTDDINHVNAVKAWLYDKSIPVDIVEDSWNREKQTNKAPNFLNFVKYNKTWWNFDPQMIEKLVKRHYPELIK